MEAESSLGSHKAYRSKNGIRFCPPFFRRFDGEKTYSYFTSPKGIRDILRTVYVVGVERR